MNNYFFLFFCTLTMATSTLFMNASAAAPAAPPKKTWKKNAVQHLFTDPNHPAKKSAAPTRARVQRSWNWRNKHNYDFVNPVLAKPSANIKQPAAPALAPAPTRWPLDPPYSANPVPAQPSEWYAAPPQNRYPDPAKKSVAPTPTPAQPHFNLNARDSVKESANVKRPAVAALRSFWNTPSSADPVPAKPSANIKQPATPALAPAPTRWPLDPFDSVNPVPAQPSEAAIPVHAEPKPFWDIPISAEASDNKKIPAATATIWGTHEPAKESEKYDAVIQPEKTWLEENQKYIDRVRREKKRKEEAFRRHSLAKVNKARYEYELQLAMKSSKALPQKEKAAQHLFDNPNPAKKAVESSTIESSDANPKTPEFPVLITMVPLINPEGSLSINLQVSAIPAANSEPENGEPSKEREECIVLEISASQPSTQSVLEASLSPGSLSSLTQLAFETSPSSKSPLLKLSPNNGTHEEEEEEEEEELIAVEALVSSRSLSPRAHDLYEQASLETHPILQSPKQSPKASSRRSSMDLIVTVPYKETKQLVKSKTVPEKLTVGEELPIAQEQAREPQPMPILFLNTPLTSPKNDAQPETLSASAPQETGLTVTIQKPTRKKGPLGATWWYGTRRGRIKHAFETYPDSPRSNTYREELRGLQEIEQDATERSLALKISRPESITTENIDRKILDRIINGCTTLDVALNPTVFFQIWEVSKQLKDQQIHYVDTHSLALIQDCLEKLAHFMGDRNPLTADMTRSQRAANALCKGVNYDPENESDDENTPWGPEEIFNSTKMKKPVSIKIPGSKDTLEFLITFKKAEKPGLEL